MTEKTLCMKETIIKLRHRVRNIRLILPETDVSAFTTEEYARFQGALAESQRRERKLRQEVLRLEKMLAKVHENAFQEGCEKGRERSEQESQPQIEALKTELDHLKKRCFQAGDHLEKPLLELVRNLTETVIGVEVEQREEMDSILLERLRNILYELVEQNNVIVAVNPLHLEYLKQQDISRVLDLPDKLMIRFVGDPHLIPGECMIKSEDFWMDGTFSGQLDALIKQLLTEDA